MRLHLTAAERTRRGIDAAFSDLVTQAWQEVCRQVAAQPGVEIVITVEAEHGFDVTAEEAGP